MFNMENSAVTKKPCGLWPPKIPKQAEGQYIKRRSVPHGSDCILGTEYWAIHQSQRERPAGENDASLK